MTPEKDKVRGPKQESPIISWRNIPRLQAKMCQKLFYGSDSSGGDECRDGMDNLVNFAFIVLMTICL